MKRLILAILMMFVFSVSVFAAGDCPMTSQTPTAAVGQDWLQITIVCTADSGDASFPDTLIDFDLTGRYLHQVRTKYGSTGPTDNTDLQLNEDITGTGHDILNGSGLNRIDNGADNDFQPTIDGSPGVVGVYGKLYTNIDNNSVNSAIVTIILDFIK